MKKVLMMCVMLMGTTMLSGCGEYGKGDKVGVITKMVKQGMFCKTWEGQILRGGMVDGTGAMGAPFEFTVEDSTLAEKVQTLMNDRKEVRITYRMEYFSLCRSDANSTFLTGIEEVLPATPHTPSSGIGETSVTTGSSRDEDLRRLGELVLKLSSPPSQ